MSGWHSHPGRMSVSKAQRLLGMGDFIGRIRTDADFEQMAVNWKVAAVAARKSGDHKRERLLNEAKAFLIGKRMKYRHCHDCGKTITSNHRKGEPPPVRCMACNKCSRGHFRPKIPKSKLMLACPRLKQCGTCGTECRVVEKILP